MAADFIAVNLNQIGFSGAWHDPVAALVFCTPANVDYSVINGRMIVREGKLTNVNLRQVMDRHNKLARQLVYGT